MEITAISGSDFDGIQHSGISFSAPIPATLRHSLITGTIPIKHIAKLLAVLDEAPLSVLSAAVDEMELELGEPRKATWQKMRQLAVAVDCTRDIWVTQQTSSSRDFTLD